jgi:hypothetical protein
MLHDDELLEAAYYRKLSRMKTGRSWTYFLEGKRINKNRVLGLLRSGHLSVPENPIPPWSGRIDLTEKGLAYLAPQVVAKRGRR